MTRPSTSSGGDRDRPTSPPTQETWARRVLALPKRALSRRYDREWALCTAVIAYSVVFSLYIIDKYNDFRSGYFDFGNAIQLVWLASHGYVTAYVYDRPIMLLAAVIGWAAPVPVVLAVFESVALATAAIPVYLIANRVLRSRDYALGFALLYLLFPALTGVNQYEFHDLSLCIPFLLFMVYFYLQRSPIPFVITALLALTTTEYAVIMVALFAGTVIWEYFATERPRSLLPYIILPLVLAAVWVAYLQSVALIPTYTFATVNNQAYTFTGSSAFLNPVAILANPVYSFSYALPAKLLYLTLVFGPFLLLSVRTPRWLLPAAPWILVVLFFSPLVQAGGIGAVYQIWSQWSSFLIPFVVISAIVTFGRVTRRERAAKAEPVRSGRRIFAAMAVTMAIVVVAAGAFSPFLPQTSLSIGDGIVPTDVAAGALWHGVWPTPVVNAPEVDRFISLIPGSYSVLTQNQIGSKLGERIAPVYIFFQPGSAPVETDAILVDTQLAGFCSSCLTQTLLNGDYLIYAADPAAGITLYFEVG